MCVCVWSHWTKTEKKPQNDYVKQQNEWNTRTIYICSIFYNGKMSNPHTSHTHEHNETKIIMMKIFLVESFWSLSMYVNCFCILAENFFFQKNNNDDIFGFSFFASTLWVVFASIKLDFFLFTSDNPMMKILQWNSLSKICQNWKKNFLKKLLSMFLSVMFVNKSKNLSKKNFFAKSIYSHAHTERDLKVFFL